jgi:hypothetical protein
MTVIGKFERYAEENGCDQNETLSNNLHGRAEENPQKNL